MIIPFAPIQEKMLNASGILEQTWLQFLSGVGVALKGEWNNSEYKIIIDNNGVDLEPNRTVLALKGSTIEVSMHFANPVSFTNAKFNIKGSNNKDLNFEDTYLNIYDVGGFLLGGAYASGPLIEIPNVASTGHCTISGTLILKETKNNIGGN